jgi:hypothetical protein
VQPAARDDRGPSARSPSRRRRAGRAGRRALRPRAEGAVGAARDSRARRTRRSTAIARRRGRSGLEVARRA